MSLGAGLVNGPLSQVVDARLVPGAAVVWSITLLGVFSGWVPLAVTAVVALCLMPVVLTFFRARRWLYGVLLAVVLAAVTATGMAIRTHQLAEHPLRSAARDGQEVTVRLRLDRPATPLTGPSYGARSAQARAIARGELLGYRVDGEWNRVGGDVLLLVPTDSWTHLLAGQRLTTHGSLIAPRSGDLLVAVLSVREPPSDLTPAPVWQRIAEELRAGLRRAATAVLGVEAAGLLPGLVVGDTAHLASTVVHDFEQAGLSHLLAVSGANVAIVCGAVLLLLRLVGAGPVMSASAAGLAMLGFVVLAGPEPSVLRAAAMGAITLLALAMGRERSALPALSASVIGLLLLIPELATSAGFALSVAATAALIMIAPAWSAALRARGVPSGWAEAIAVPAAAHIATAPLVAALTGHVSVIGVLANMLAGPVVAPATVLGFAATVASPVAPWLAETLVWLAGPELEWVLLVADRAADVPGATFGWPSGTMGGLLLAASITIVLIAVRSRRMRWALATLVLLGASVMVPVRIARPSWPVAGWSVVVCDVGQGDSLVLATGTPGAAVVVDTGPRPAVTDACLDRLGITRVPLVVLTHLHADHIGGLVGVLEERDVGAVAVGGTRKPHWAYEQVQQIAEAAGVPLVRLPADSNLRWSSLTLDLLAPRSPLPRTSAENLVNNRSAVIMATTPAGRVLLTGDIELRRQARLLASDQNLRADILKVPHHGSRYTSPRFLRAVRARLALISVGHANDYGHPSKLVVSVLKRTGATVLRTDEAGDIAVLGGPDGLRTVSRGDPLRPEST